MNLIVIKTISIILILISESVFAISVKEEHLFDIQFNTTETSSGLLYMNAASGIKGILNGPVQMSENRLLFYSEKGYLLYSIKGELVEQFTLEKENKNKTSLDSTLIKLAFPIDASTLLFYQKNIGEIPIIFYVKKIGKGKIKKLKEKEDNKYSKVLEGSLLNLLFNTITDEMASTFISQRYLVGDNSDAQMWSLDNYYSAISPVILSGEEKFIGFYPGVRIGKSKNNFSMSNPHQVFRRNENWVFTGIRSDVGSQNEKNYQYISNYDIAGNVMWKDSILKQENKNSIVGEDDRTFYTMVKIAKYVGMPSINRVGRVVYGVTDLTNGVVSLYKREYSNYIKEKSTDKLSALIKTEESVEYTPLVILCGREGSGKQIADVMITDVKGRRIKGQIRHLEKDGYIARVSRVKYRDIYSKLARKKSGMPFDILSYIDSLSEESSTGCPYVVSISSPHGMLRSFDYPFGTRVLSARLLTVTNSKELIVRVDCENFAEILIFDDRGGFEDRIKFNNQNYKVRKDIFVSDKNGLFIEADYESSDGLKNYFEWKERF